MKFLKNNFYTECVSKKAMIIFIILVVILSISFIMNSKSNVNYTSFDFYNYGLGITFHIEDYILLESALPTPLSWYGISGILCLIYIMLWFVYHNGRVYQHEKEVKKWIKQ